MSFKQILRKIKKTLDRPLAFTAIKFKTSFLYKKNLKNPKYETKLNKALNKKERIYLNYFKKHYSYVLNIKKDNENNLNENLIYLSFGIKDLIKHLNWLKLVLKA